MFKTRAAKILEAALAISCEDVHDKGGSSSPFTEADFDRMPIDLVLGSDNSNITTIIEPATSVEEITLYEQNNSLVEELDINNEAVTEFQTLDSIIFESPRSLSNSNNYTFISEIDDNGISQTLDDQLSLLQENSGIDSTENNNLIPEVTVQSSRLKLVEYDTSSDDNDEKSEVHLAGTSKNQTKLFKRFNSDRSFNSSASSSDDSDFRPSDENHETDDDVETGQVGSRGKRKKKQINKKLVKKIENCLGLGKTVHDIPCKEKCQNQCAQKFNNIKRHDIHEFYWGLGSYERQRNWLLSCVESVPIRRRIQAATVSRRQNTFKYFINWNDERVEVCQQFLLKTLGISQMSLRYAVQNAIQKSAKPDGRGKHVPHNKTSAADRREIHDFIKKLPAVLSHYCRNKSDRKYLPAELRNISFVYRLFSKEREKDGKAQVSLKVFRGIFLKDFNLGFHQPKKDKCRMCESRKDNAFQETEASKDAFAKHLEMKEQCKELFLADQKKHLTEGESNYVCASFDLQKVLNTPHGDNLLLYYSRKYSFYNETVYESGTRNGICFIWGESDGNRGCSEICTIIFKYLESLDKKCLKHVVLYCDSCSGQNRNRAMLVMLKKFIQDFAEHLETIKIVFLLPGHTYMPVDSVHATIERAVRKMIVWAPSEWETILRNARVNPKPLEIVRMQHSEFKNWKKVGDEFLAPNTKTSDGKPFKISLVRQAIFQKGTPNFQVNYSYDSVSNMDVLLMAKTVGRRNHNAISLSSLYPAKLPISALKKKDLDQLCNQNVIPIRFHQEFFDFRSKASVRDTLPETDGEDPTDMEDN